ncbi:MAG: hypothetical protein IPM55_16490 [Acidobacteria bacterium]|nr:hypothetical protein [Acidobacteriota bacterium]
MIGKHNVYNALAAAAAGCCFRPFVRSDCSASGPRSGGDENAES